MRPFLPPDWMHSIQNAWKQLCEPIAARIRTLCYYCASTYLEVELPAILWRVCLVGAVFESRAQPGTVTKVVERTGFLCPRQHFITRTRSLMDHCQQYAQHCAGTLALASLR